MFDFIHLISSKSNIVLQSNQTHAQHLRDGSYNKYRVQGKGFCSEIYCHANTARQGYEHRADTHLFLIGHAYTNRKHTSLTALKQHKLDASMLLDIYERFGQDIILYIKGIFVIFIADESKNCQYAFVSRSGLLKLFYYHDSERILLSTSMAALVQNLPHTPVLDDLAVIQQGFFGYTLGTRTHFMGVRILDNLRYLTVSEGSVRESVYTSISAKLTEGTPLSWKDTKAMLPRQFNQVMDTIIPDGPFNSAITAGYDSRTVLSYILRHGVKKCRLFSWAADERWSDVAIAKQIAGNFNLYYTHVVLGDDMKKSYPFYAAQQVYWTDGMGSINRTNQMYSHSILAEYSRELMTGYFGSELLRPLHRQNVMMREVFMDLLLGINRERLLENQYELFAKSSGFQDDYLKEHRSVFLQSVLEHMQELDIGSDNGVTVLHFLIRYGFWKFFGQEFHAQRIHTNIQSPYIDDDFIDFILGSCIREVHQGTYQRNPILLMRSQALYNPIIKRNCNQLMFIPTNRGFAPSDYDSILFPVSVLCKFQMNRMKKKKDTIKGFEGYNWHKCAYMAFPQIVNEEDNVFIPLKENLLQDGAYFSLKKWLSECR